MNVKKKDFQRVARDLKEFLSKLSGTDTAELRDSLNFSLLHLHKYYKRLRHKTKATPLLDGSLSLTSSLGSFSPASPFISPANKFDWRWINLDSSTLSASFGHGDHRNLLPEIFYVLKDGIVDRLKEIILQEPDSVNEVDALGRSTISYCLHGKSDEHLQCLDILIQQGVDLQQEANDGQTPIHIAILSNNEKGLDRLLSKKVNVNVEDNEGRYPMHLAAAYSTPSVVKKLLKSGGDKDTLDNDEMTPVMWACHFDNYQNLELLLNISADNEMRYEVIDAEIQDKDVNGKSLLHWSVSRSSSKHCFKVIFCADYAYFTDNFRKTILHCIAENGVIGALEEYLSQCELNDLDITDQHGRTPLHLACIGGHGEIVDIFLNRGASLEVVDDTGKTPLDYAKSKNLNYCLLVILSYLKYRQKASDNVEGELKAQEMKRPIAIITNIDGIEKNVQQSVRGTNVTKKNNKVVLQNEMKSRKLSPSENNKLSRSQKIHLHEEEEEEEENRRDSDISQFDTPQDFQNPNDNHSMKKLSKFNSSNDKRKQHETDYYDKDHNEEELSEDYNFNNQLIVLVEHQGSDDELVIDIDGGNDVNNSAGEVDVDEDQDLLDVTPFARNGSITTVGVVSEGSMAFNSVSLNPSVSSLVSSDSDDGKDVHKSASQKRSSRDEKIPPRREPHMEQRPSHGKKPLNKPQKSDYSPRLRSNSGSGGDMPSLISSITAPVPPPSQYYGGIKGGMSQNSQVLVMHSDDNDDYDEQPAIRRNINETRPKTSKGPGSRSTNKKNNRSQLEQSWPPPSKPQQKQQHDGDYRDGDSLRQPISPRSSSLRLAPLSPAALPKPPSYKYGT